MCLKECLCFLKHVLLHRLKNLCQLCCNLIERNYDLFSCITTNDNRLVILNILRSDLNTCRDSENLLSAELPSRCFVWIIDFHFVSCCLQCIKKFICLIKYAFLMLGDRDHHRLNRCNSRWNHKTAVISVYHDQCSDYSCGHSPGCLVNFMQFIIFICILNVKCIRERISEEMACRRL